MGSSSCQRWMALVFLVTACGGRTGLDVPGDACLDVSADCDGDAANGCEVDLHTSAQHCGACGVVCEAGLACSEGACVEGGRIVQLEARTSTQYARTADGRVFAWGDNRIGQVDPTSAEALVYTPWQVPLPGPSAEIRAGWARACSRGADGAVWCWGMGEPLSKKEGLVGVTKLMADRHGFCTFDAYGGRKCWTTSVPNGLDVGSGEDADAIMEDVVYGMEALPRPLSFLLPSAAITADGALITWGHRGTTGRNTPYGELYADVGVVTDAHGVIRIDTGEQAGLCATERHGDILCWGTGFDEEEHLVPKRFFVDGPYKRAAIGPWMCGLRTDGELRCFDSEFPVLEASQVAEVSASNTNICIVTFDGRLMCQGGNTHGGLGQDPAVLPRSSEFVDVAAPP